MKLDSYQSMSGTGLESTALDRSIKPYLNRSHQQFQAATWVKLLEPPSPFCSDTALLLCQESENEWLGWIPDYGEIKLHTYQFCQVN